MTTISIGKSLNGVKGFKDMLTLSYLNGGDYNAINFSANGDITIAQFMPKVRKEEKRDFLYRTIRFYEYRMPNGITAILIRGSMSCDLIINPNIYPDDRLTHITDDENTLATVVQYDTYKDKVTGIRTISLPIMVRQRIKEICSSNMKYSKAELDNAMVQYIYPVPYTVLEEMATYIGCEEASVITNNLVIL